MVVSRNAGKFAVRFVSFILCTLLVLTGFFVFGPARTVSADAGASAWWISQWDDSDAGKIGISTWGVNKGDVVEVTIISASDIYFNGSTSGDVSCTSDGDSVTVQYTYTGQNVEFAVVGTNITDNSVSVGSVSVIQSASTPTPTPTPSPTPSPTPKPTPKPTETTAETTKATQPTETTKTTQATTQATTQTTQTTTQATAAQTTAADNSGGNAETAAPAAAAAGDATVATTTKATAAGVDETIEETTDPTETAAADDMLTAGASQETVMSVVGEVKDGESYDETVILDETHEDGSPVVMGLKSTTQEELNAAKARKQMVTTWSWVVFFVLLAGAGYARYRYLKVKKGYKGSEIAINFIPGANDLIYAIGYHFNIGKGKETVPVTDLKDTDTHASFNTASAMKELKKMEAVSVKAETKATTPSVPHKRPKELSVNHAAAIAAQKAAQGSPKTATAPAAPKAPAAAKAPVAPKAPAASKAPAAPKAPASARAEAKPVAPSPFKPAPETASIASVSAAEAHQRAEAAREQLRMRAEARKSKIEEAKKADIQQRPPVKRPASLSVNHAAVAAAAARTTAESANKETTTTRSAEEVQPNNPPSPFKPLDRSAERAIYSTPGLRPRKSAEDHQKMAAAPDQLGLGKAIGAQKPEAPYARGGRAPMWAAPGTGRVNPFKPSAEAAAEPANETEPAAPAQKAEPAAHASIADQPTRRSAFFDRAEKPRTPAPSREDKVQAVGDMTRPSGKGKAPHAPVKGMSLEGKDSSLLNNGARPTATKPLPGFKPVDGNK